MTCIDNLYVWWDGLPTGRENAVSYDDLVGMWGCSKRSVRKILHELSRFDSGDGMVLIRSCHGGGFYKTDNEEIIKAYRRECLNKGRATLAPLKQIDRVLRGDMNQAVFYDILAELDEGSAQK